VHEVGRTIAAASTRKRQRLEVEARREQLLALGMALFAAKPYDEVSIDEVARKARISKGLLYHYFPTKRDFYVAGVREAAKRLLEETEPDESLDPATNLRAGLEAYLDFVERHGQAYVALMRGGVGSDREVTRILDQTRGEFVERAMAKLPMKPTPVARLAFRGWIGFIEALATEWLLHAPVPRAEVCSMAEFALLALIGRLVAE
jgi:AcrR family transcriptional regulator